VMIIGLGLTHNPELKTLVLIKEAIWTFMTVNFIGMFIRRRQAEKAFISGDSEKAKAIAMIISKYMIPVNIVLGVVAIYLGVTLRGF